MAAAVLDQVNCDYKKERGILRIHCYRPHTLHAEVTQQCIQLVIELDVFIEPEIVQEITPTASSYLCLSSNGKFGFLLLSFAVL